MTDPEVRERVIRAFEAARAEPAAPYDPDRFMAFLTREPAKSGRRVADTFAGRRRLVRFVEAVQLELGVCFTNADWDRGLALDAFVALAEEKVGKPEQALRLAQRRVTGARARLYADPLKFALLCSPLAVAALALPILAVAGLVTPLAVAALAQHDYRYARRLVARIEQR